MEISGISNDGLENDLEDKVFGVFKNSDVLITSNYMESCHDLSLGRTSTTENKQVIIKFVNRNIKNSCCVQRKKSVPKLKYILITRYAHIIVFSEKIVKVFKERVK